MRSIVLAVLLLFYPLTWIIPPVIGLMILFRLAYHLQ
jgi:hypothetical protein